MVERITSNPSLDQPLKIKPKWLTTLGILFALGWIIITISQQNPLIFLVMGGLNLLTTITSRIIARKKNALELEGGIMGFLVAWIICFGIYGQKNAILDDLGLDLQVNEIMVLYLAIIFLVWFLISPKKHSQEIIFNLPPFYSNLLLNVWKLTVILLFLTGLRELQFLSEVTVGLFLFIGYFNLVVFYYYRLVKLDYLDIILNPIKLLGSLFSGPLEAIKWILLTIIFILLDQMDLHNLVVLGLIGFAIFMAIMSFSTSTTKLLLSSGVIESRVQEGKTLVPQVLEEVQGMASMETISTFNEYYEINQRITIRKANEQIIFSKGDLIFRLPFSLDLESKTGIFLFHLNKHEMLIKQTKSKKWQKWDQNSKGRQRSQQRTGTMKAKDTNRREISLSGMKFHRMGMDEWKKLQEVLVSVDKEKFLTTIGFENAEEFERELAKAIRGTVIAQQQIRSRLRGIPAPPVKPGDQIHYDTKIENSSISIPNNILQGEAIINGQTVELIPGKDEYLFYAKIKHETERKRSLIQKQMTILITGAGKGLGFALTKSLLERDEDHTIYAFDINLTPELEHLKTKFQNTLHLFSVDVTNEEELMQATKEVARLTSTIDILINSAAIYLERNKPDIDELDFTVISKTIETNVLGTMKVIKHFLPFIRKSQKRKLIINISSEAGSISNQYRESEYGYTMAKAAMNMFSQILQNRLKKEKIKVLAIAPGWFSSEMGGSDAPLTPEQAASRVAAILFLDWVIEDPIYVDTNARPMSW
ncbi:MAG: SDR family NAD(P)-dependent oxidoreductase [Promethearchaeota archaeon]